MELRWYQSDACAAVWRDLRAKPGNPLVDLPTGAGKSVVIAELCRKAVQKFAGRAIVLAHRKELLRQNADKIAGLLPWTLTPGIYSAGLSKRDTDAAIVCAGIQSVYDKAHLFGRRHLLIIDEAHCVPTGTFGDAIYARFIRELAAINPGLKVVGLTATPFRTGEGALWGPGCLFSHIAFTAPMRRLMDEGYLSPVTSSPSAVQYDTSKLKEYHGEFRERDVIAVFGDDEKMAAAAKEIVACCADRQSVLVFASGVSHAEKMANHLGTLTGERCEVVTGDTPKLMRAATLAAFTARRLRWLVNVDCLTTGFDAPCVDAIAMLRATASPGLFAQICGRGLRLYPGKANCLVLDFGNNIQRHGPIDDVDYGQPKKKGGGGGEAPAKQCPGCQSQQPAGVRVCPDCGFEFPPLEEARHDATADKSAAILSEPAAPPKRYCIKAAYHGRNVGRHPKPDTLRVDYLCTDEEGGEVTQQISEWVCIEHEGGGRRMAERWWRMRSPLPCPATIAEAIDIIDAGAFAHAVALHAYKEGKYWRVARAERGDVPTHAAAQVMVRDLKAKDLVANRATGQYVNVDSAYGALPEDEEVPF